MTELIKAASIARVTSKAGKFLGFLVKSDNTTEYYQVTCLKINGHCEFFCNCIGFRTHGHCKHCNACKELVAARKEMKEAAPVATVETTPAELPMVVRLCDSSTTVYVVSNGQYELIRISDLKTVCPNGYHDDPDNALVLFEMMHGPQTKTPKTKEVSCKRAPQFANMPMTIGRGFVVQQVPELNGRMVPMKHAA